MVKGGSGSHNARLPLFLGEEIILFRVLLSLLPLLLAFIVVALANGNDRHAGYYYPPIASDEVYRARSRVMGDANRAMRIGFFVTQTEAQRKSIYPPR